MTDKKKSPKVVREEAMLDAILKMGDGLNNLAKEFKEFKDGRTGSSGNDVASGTAPVREVREPRQAGSGQVPRHERGTDHAEHREGAARYVDAHRQARERDAENALQQGAEGVISSYRPANEPAAPPPRAQQSKIIYEDGDVISCTKCKEPIFSVIKPIYTTTKLGDLIRHLDAYSEKIERPTEDTRIKCVGGVATDCPLCGETWGVVIF